MLHVSLASASRLALTSLLVFSTSKALAAGVGGLTPTVPKDSPCDAPTPDSNMGFSAHRSLTTVFGYRNIHLVSVPSFNGLGDVADTGAAMPCSGSDGVVNADDLLCDWWTSRQGSMVVSRRNEPLEQWDSRMAYRDAATGDIVFAGDWTAPLIADEAFLVSVSGADNLASLVGSHDPNHPGHVLQPAPSGNDALVILNVPYHTMYRTADEILCGLPIARDPVNGWEDIVAPIGEPDTCPNGIFDNASGTLMTVSTYDNVADGQPTDGTFVERSVRRDPATGLLEFTGIDFLLETTHAYFASYGATHQPTTFLSPHY